MPLKRSIEKRRSAVPDDYIVFLHEHEVDIKVMEDDMINFHQAMESSNSRKWINVMNKIRDLVPLLEGAKHISYKWIFKTKRDLKGNVERYKARLVTKDFTQKECIDYEEAFSIISSKDSFRFIMALMAYFNLELYQMDVKMTFLNGDFKNLNAILVKDLQNRHLNVISLEKFLVDV